jgi:hypothetical protein
VQLINNHNEYVNTQIDRNDTNPRFSEMLHVVDLLVVADVLKPSVGPVLKGQGIASFLNMGPTLCPEMSVTSYQSTLRNSPEKRRYYVQRGGSLKSRM